MGYFAPDPVYLMIILNGGMNITNTRKGVWGEPRPGFAPRGTGELRPKRPGRASPQKARAGFAPIGPGGLRPKRPGRASPEKARAGFAPKAPDGFRSKRHGRALPQKARAGFAPKGPGGLRSKRHGQASPQKARAALILPAWHFPNLSLKGAKVLALGWHWAWAGS